jgi:hypothetical protein
MLAHTVAAIGRLSGLLALSAAAFPQIVPVSNPVPNTVEKRVEYHYVLSARVRPLLFWIGRDNVGRGRISWTEAVNGGRELELLIGTDPDRVPMRINRWGYISEFVREDEARVTGIMTKSDEETVDEAKRKVERREGAGDPYQAIRTRFQAGESITTATNLMLPQTVTYRSLEAVLEGIREANGVERRVPLPENAGFGFLTAVAGLIQESVEAHRQGGALARNATRAYLFDSRPYALKLRSSKPLAGFRLGGVPCRVLESEFQVVNRVTGHVTEFRITYGVEPPMSGVPVRVVFRPKWWFEAELNLTSGSEG